MVGNANRKSLSSEENKDIRISILTVAIFLFALIIILRLFSLQVLQNPFYSIMATKKHEVYKDLIPHRGSIYVRENGELFPLVTNKDYYTVYAEPVDIESPNTVIDKITPILGLEEEEWKDLLGRIAKKDDPYEPIKKRVPKDQVEKISALELKGVGYVSESYRFYPEKNIGGHIFGFVSQREDQKVGQYGLEGYFQEELAGQFGLVKSVRDALGSLMTIGPRSVKKAEDGQSLVLTIDKKIQFFVCQKLKEFYDWFEADSGSVVIMEPNTGAIIAMCSLPDFDPEKYNEVKDINHLNNPAIFSDYEPGSIFKPVTMSIALDLGRIEPNSTYIDEGEVKIGPYKIRNSDLKAHGQQTMTEILEKSLNTGTIYVADLVGKNNFKKYVEKFGFGQKTGVTLDSEVAGNLSSLEKRGEIYYLTGSYGQGITATSLQMVTAFSVFANGGKLVKPYIISEVINSDGEITKTQPQEIRQVIKNKTATIITGMLTSVIENGHSGKAGVEGYYLAGKTGTAQVASEAGGYGEKTIHSFVGFGPVSNPKFTMIVKLDNPKGIKFAADSVAPLFSQIADYLIKYYQIPPEY